MVPRPRETTRPGTVSRRPRLGVRRPETALSWPLQIGRLEQTGAEPRRPARAPPHARLAQAHVEVGGEREQGSPAGHRVEQTTPQASAQRRQISRAGGQAPCASPPCSAETAQQPSRPAKKMVPSASPALKHGGTAAAKVPFGVPPRRGEARRRRRRRLDRPALAASIESPRQRSRRRRAAAQVPSPSASPADRPEHGRLEAGREGGDATRSSASPWVRRSGLRPAKASRW